MTTQPPSNESLFQQGQVIAGRYEIIDLLGVGGMGAVYSCKDRQLNGQQIALKVLWKRLVDQPVFLERFRREIICSYTVNHRNVVRAYDMFQDGEVSGFTMEYVGGGSLAEIIDNESVSIENVERFLGQIAEGLRVIHNAGIIHRDIKPENVLLAKDGTVKIADFGIAHLPDRETLTQGELVGSIDSVSPEYLLEKKNDARSDIYALGVLSYKLITGTTPFESGLVVDLMDEKMSLVPPDPQQLRPDCPDYLASLTRRAMLVDPEARIQNAEAFQDALVSKHCVKLTKGMLVTYSRFDNQTPEGIRWTIPFILAMATLLLIVVNKFLEPDSLEVAAPVVINQPPAKSAPPPTTDDLPQPPATAEAPKEQPPVKLDSEPLVPPEVVAEPEAAPEPKPEPPRLTRLRVVGKPIGRWERSDRVSLTYVETRVRNAGSVTAEDIVVSVKIPGGDWVVVDGPTELKRKKTALYSRELNEEVRSRSNLKARVTCANCRR